MTAVQQWWFNGGGLQPGLVFYEDFESGLGLYSTVSGNGALFSLIATSYSQSLHVAAQNAVTPAAIQRVLSAPVTFNRIEVKFRLRDNNPDDAAVMTLSNGVTDTLYWNPRRETAYDDLRRPEFKVGALIGKAAAGSLSNNVWYKVRFVINAGDGNSDIDLFDAATDTLLFHNDVAGTFAPISFDRIKFTADSGNITIGTDYDDLYCYNE